MQLNSSSRKVFLEARMQDIAPMQWKPPTDDRVYATADRDNIPWSSVEGPFDGFDQRRPLQGIGHLDGKRRTRRILMCGCFEFWKPRVTRSASEIVSSSWCYHARSGTRSRPQDVGCLLEGNIIIPGYQLHMSNLKSRNIVIQAKLQRYGDGIDKAEDIRAFGNIFSVHVEEFDGDQFDYLHW